MQNSLTNRRQRVLIISLLLVLYCYFSVWALTIPFDGAPDEELRYLIPQYIYHHGTLPTGFDSEVIYREGYYSYAFYPQFLGGIVSAGFMSLSKAFAVKTTGLLYLARLTSIFSGLGTVYLIGKTSQLLTKSFSVRIIMMLMIGLWPQITFLSTYINNDIIGLFGLALVMQITVSILQRSEWYVRDTCFLAIGYVICLLSYMNTYVFLLFSAMQLFVVLIKRMRVGQKSIFWLINHVLLLVTIILILAGPFFVRNYLLYHDWFGNTIFLQRNQLWVSEGHPPTLFPFKTLVGGRFGDLLVYRPYWELTLKSFIGYFGYMSIPLSGNSYKFLLMITGIGFLSGLGKSFIGQLREYQLGSLFCGVGQVVAGGLTAVLCLHRAYHVDFQAQGRYLIALIIPIMLMVAIGYGNLFAKLSAKVKIIGLLMFSLSLICCSLLTYYYCIYIPYIELGLRH